MAGGFYNPYATAFATADLMHVKYETNCRRQAIFIATNGMKIMSAFEEREAAAEARYVHQLEADAADRFKRIRALGQWACGLMEVSSEEEVRYLDLLYRLGLSTQDDLLIVERVRDDIAAAGISISTARVNEMLGAGEEKA